MKTVYKYPLQHTDEQILEVPVGSQILSVANQSDTIVLYALVDTEVKQMQNISIYIHGTGHVVYGEDIVFVGTVPFFRGNLMFHVFGKLN